jgi:membrane fusion protein (multidrug efflux system)
VDYTETEVDPGTGTLQIRGVFPNPGEVPKLLPGLFARVRMPIEQRENALLVSERAIGADQGGPYVLVVASDNHIEKRPIRQGQLINGMRVIEEGLQADEWLVVKGVQRARPGAEVDPEKIDMATLSTSALSKTAAEKADSTAPATNEEEGEPASGDTTPSAPEEAQAAQVQPASPETETQPAASSPAAEQSTSTPEETDS